MPPSNGTCNTNNSSSSHSHSVNSSRSMLSTATIIKWLRTHYQNKNRKNHHYLYFPQQLMRQNSIEQIFTEFDADGSGGLSRDEVFDMFNGFGIRIRMEHLNRLYDSVEVDLEELDCDKFKKCALGQRSNKVFRQIVREIEAQKVMSKENGFEEEDQGQVTLEMDTYFPHNFTNMIIYLVYLSKRDELKKQILDKKQGPNDKKDNKKISIRDKVDRMDSLLKLKDLSLNNQRLHIHSEGLKTNLKNKFRDIWERCNEKHGQKFPHTAKSEEEFYQFFLEKQRQETMKEQEEAKERQQIKKHKRDVSLDQNGCGE